jgi:uncharacterized membrane protein (DUF2068 family)
MSAPDPKVAPWEDLVLRLIAIYKFLKAGLAVAIGLTLLHLIHSDVNKFLHDYVATPLHIDLDNPVDPDDAENKFLRSLVEWAAGLSHHALRTSAYFAFFCAAVFATEGVGLYLKKHWAEYLVIVVTGVPLPFEIYMLFHQVYWWKVLLMVGNLLIIGYLIHRLRLDYHNRKARELAAAQKASDRENKAPAPTAAASRVP